jgi:hypothetical protein
MQIQPRKPDVTEDEIGVVLLGDFNPKIYQPAWFASEGLIRPSEADNAKIQIVHADLAIFSTDWFVLQVARDRFSATIKALAYRAHLRDLVLGTFHKLLHTPLMQMGINCATRVRFKSDDDWHAFGHFLVPKCPWKGILSTPGMRAVHV